MNVRVSTWSLVARAALLGVMTAAMASPAARAGPARRALFLVGMGDETAWQDMAYLAAVPAAMRVTDKAPAVIG